MAPSASPPQVFPRNALVRVSDAAAHRPVIWLRGEHDVSTVATVWDTIAQVVDHDDTDLIVDLSQVQFMGASTVGVIVRAKELLRPRARHLAVRAPSRCARRVLDLCSLGELIEAEPAGAPTTTSPADALGSWVAVRAAGSALPRRPVAADRPSTGTDTDIQPHRRSVDVGGPRGA